MPKPRAETIKSSLSKVKGLSPDQVLAILKDDHTNLKQVRPKYRIPGRPERRPNRKRKEQLNMNDIMDD